MKKNIAIIGGGNSGKRFCEALIFNDIYEIFLIGSRNGKAYRLANYYGLEFIELKNFFFENINLFNIIILSIPPEHKIKIFNKIINKKYYGSFIFEKPLTLKTIYAKNIFNTLINNNLKAIVAFNREFDSSFLNKEIIKYFNSFNKIKIFWPYHSYNSFNPIIHQLPHILNYLLILSNSKKLNILNFKNLNNGNFSISGKIKMKQFEIYLFKEKSNDKKVLINDLKIEWPNYLISHLNMVKKVNNISFKDFYYQFERAIFITNCIENILNKTISI